MMMYLFSIGGGGGVFETLTCKHFDSQCNNDASQSSHKTYEGAVGKSDHHFSFQYFQYFQNGLNDDFDKTGCIWVLHA